MAARMPACYAAVYKVLEEVSVRLPTFTPESMLDFGAGPGTAIWAAHEVLHLSPDLLSCPSKHNMHLAAAALLKAQEHIAVFPGASGMFMNIDCTIRKH